MSVVIDNATEESAKNHYDGEFDAASVVDTSGDMQAAEAECLFCSHCSITL